MIRWIKTYLGLFVVHCWIDSLSSMLDTNLVCVSVPFKAGLVIKICFLLGHMSFLHVFPVVNVYVVQL